MRMRTNWLFFGLALLLASGCECDFFDSNEMDGGIRNAGVDDPCMETNNCRAGLVCDTALGSCQPPGDVTEGGICSLTGDCVEGLYCGPRRTCVPAGTGTDGTDCNTTADCEPGLVCSLEGFGFRCRGTSEGDIGDSCVTELDCLPGLACLAGEGGALRCLNPPVFDGDGGVNGMLPPTVPLWQGETCQEDDGPPTAYFRLRRGNDTDLDFYRLPFPNDVLRNPAGGLDLTGHPSPATALSVDVLGRHIESAADTLDGFATNPVVYFRFSRPYEWGDITPESVLLIDITPESPDYGNNLNRTWLTTVGRITRYICPDWLTVRRGHGEPLREGTTYAAILLEGIRTNAEEGAEEFARDEDLDALLGDSAPAGDPLAGAWQAYQPLRDWLADPDTTVAADDILNVAVFTTQNATELVPAMRSAIRAEPAPTISEVTVCDEGVTSPCDDGMQRVCHAANDDYWEVHARIALPRFQAGTAPYEAPEDGGGIEVDATGTPLIQGTDEVCMMMTIPKGVTPPAEGFPVVIYGHGTGGAMTSPLNNGLGTDFATGDGGSGAPNAVTVSIDMPLHGDRRGGSDRGPDVLVFNFLNPQAARGNFQQGAADMMSLVYWAEGFTLPAADSPTGADVTLDGSRIALWGHSQGATHGMMIIPYEPGVIASVISGGGGDLTMSLLNKTQPVNIAGAVPLALLDPDGDGNLVAGDQHPALALFQMYYEAVDPVNYGRYYHREPPDMMGRHIFMTYGVGDSFTPEETMQAFARSASLPHVMPQLSDLSLGDPIATPVIGNITVNMVPYTIGVRQYNPEVGDDGHFVSTQTTQGRADTTRFIQEALVTGVVPPIGL